MLIWHERQSEKLPTVGTKAMVPAVGRLQAELLHLPEDSLCPVKVAASNLDTWPHIISYHICLVCDIYTCMHACMHTYIHTYMLVDMSQIGKLSLSNGCK